MIAGERANTLSLTDLGPVESMLVLHRSDRWYVGDFLRHACWLGWADQHVPAARVDLATHASYVPVYGDGRFGRMLDVAAVAAGDLLGYDLVVEPTSFPGTEVPAPGIRRLLRTWDRGWALYVHGREVARGVKDELNYFRAAHPASLGLPDTTGAWALVRGTPLIFSGEERRAARALLETAVPGDGPVIVYNPTASTPFTRETSAVKEVDNTLTVTQHAAVLASITSGVTGHAVLVAGPVKPGDDRNAAVIAQVGAAVAGTPLTLGLREFAAVLGDPQVCSTVGGGTGSNAHLAALVGTWSLSIERDADAVMRANWARPDDFQMGSFRWRNPCPLTAVHTMTWAAADDPPAPGRTAAAAEAFLAHHALAHGEHDDLFDRHRTPSTARHRWSGPCSVDLQLGQVLTTWMTSPARRHLADFTDELTYLRARFPLLPAAFRPADLAALLAARDTAAQADPAAVALVEQLFRDSNLHKLLCVIREPA